MQSEKSIRTNGFHLNLVQGWRSSLQSPSNVPVEGLVEGLIEGLVEGLVEDLIKSWSLYEAHT